jgi:hypothetical protein
VSGRAITESDMVETFKEYEAACKPSSTVEVRKIEKIRITKEI